VELDGAVGQGDTSKRVVVVAATNRPDILDDALLRPGLLCYICVNDNLHV
jgi:ATP-dependent Zn protease